MLTLILRLVLQDQTLIDTRNGGGFAKSADDWKWFDSSSALRPLLCSNSAPVPCCLPLTLPDPSSHSTRLDKEAQLAKLKELNDAGYLLVIFSNQGGIEKGHQTVEALKGRVEAFWRETGPLPFVAMFCIEEGPCRKPSPGMWNFLLRILRPKTAPAVDMATSFYCGDAAGRARNPTTGKKDFANSDRAFAANVGIRFMTPEEAWFKRDALPANTPWEGFDPVLFLKEKFPSALNGPVGSSSSSSSSSAPSSDSEWQSVITPLPAAKEIVLMVGSPASGKSFISEKMCAALGSGAVVFHRDQLGGSAPRLIKAGREAISSGTKKTVCLDATHATKDNRKDILNLAHSLGGVS